MKKIYLLTIMIFIISFSLQNTVFSLEINDLSSRLKSENLDGHEAFLTKIYKELLGRKPDPSGLKSFSEQLKRGTLTKNGVIKAIKNSDEYKIKNKSEIKDVSDSTHKANVKFVVDIYRELLDRDPDDSGLAHKVTGLDMGILTRIGIRKSILKSPEYKNKNNNSGTTGKTGNTDKISNTTGKITDPETKISNPDDSGSNTGKTIDDYKLPPDNSTGQSKTGHFPFSPMGSGIIAFETSGITPKSKANSNREDYIFLTMTGKGFKKVLLYHVGKKTGKGEVPGKIYMKVHLNDGKVKIIPASVSSNLPDWHQWKIAWGGGKIQLYLDNKNIAQSEFEGEADKAFVGGHWNNGRTFKGKWRNIAVFDPEGDLTGEKSDPAGTATGGQSKARLFKLSGNVCGAVEFETCGITHQTKDNVRGGDYTFMVMKGTNFQQVKLLHTCGTAPDGTPRAIRYVISSKTNLDKMGLEVASDNLPGWHKWRVEYGNGLLKFFLDGKCIGNEKGFYGIPTEVSIGGYHNGTNRNFKGRWRNFTKE